MKTLSIFGATGSIGATTLAVVAHMDGFELQLLTAQNNAELLIRQALAHRPKQVVIANPDLYGQVKEGLGGTGIAVSAGPEALRAAASLPVDIVMSAIVGFAGVEISLLAAEACSRLALANKESLVCAGALLRARCQANGTELFPVDSEHSAIFQCLEGVDRAALDQIILTASGGPFLNHTSADLEAVTPEMAAAHPRWDMGQRISIDSASLFNKALEVIEAKEFFDLPAEKISVVIHPQSVIHSMIALRDGAYLAHMGKADMSGPIALALSHPARVQLPMQRLDFTQAFSLDFQPVDADRFPALNLAYDVLEMGGLSGAVLNAAKEAALDLFLDHKVKFTMMPQIVSHALSQFGAGGARDALSFDAIADLDQEVRAQIFANHASQR